MKPTVSIRLPSGMSKKSREEKGGKESSKNKWAKPRAKEPSIQERLELARTVVAASIEDRTRVDANNLPYAWRDKGQKEAANDEAYNRKMKYKNDPVRKFPLPPKKRLEQTLGGAVDDRFFGTR